MLMLLMPLCCVVGVVLGLDVGEVVDFIIGRFISCLLYGLLVVSCYILASSAGDDGRAS